MGHGDLTMMTTLYLSFVTPTNFFGETTLPSISLIGAAAFKQLIDAGEKYTPLISS